MNVHVQLYGTLRRYSLPETPGRWSGELPDGATIEELLAEIGISPNEIAGASVDGQLRPLHWKLSADVAVTLVTPVGGG